jgi:hypothetical protein
VPSVTDPYAEDTPLTWLFRDEEDAKILAAFLSEPDTPLDTADVSRLTGIDPDDLPKKLTRMEEHGVVSCDWSDPSAPVCTVNSESKTVECLREIEQSLLQRWAGN